MLAGHQHWAKFSMAVFLAKNGYKWLNFVSHEPLVV